MQPTFKTLPTIVDSSLVSVRRVFSFFFFFFFYITLRIYTIEVQIPEAYKRTIHPALKFYSRKISRDYDREKEKRKKERKANKVHPADPRAFLIRVRLPSRVSRILESWSSGLPLHQCAGPKLRERSRANTRERSAHDVDEHHSTAILKPPVHRA